MGRGLQLSPPAVRGTGTSEETLFSAHTPDLSGPASYPKTCLREPCGHHMHTQGKRPRGLAVRRPSPGPSPHQESRSQSCEAKKALKEAARQPGLHPFVQAAQWKPAPEVLGLAPQAKWVFHVVFQGEGQVLPSGWSCQLQLWRVFAQMHAYPMYLALA